MIKLKATNTFECGRSCGVIIEKGEDTWMADDHQMVCRACAINEVYGPPPTPEEVNPTPKTPNVLDIFWGRIK